MATGFRPKSERIIELAGYSSEELMLLAIEASKHLVARKGSSFCNRRERRTASRYKCMYIHAAL